MSSASTSTLRPRRSPGNINKDDGASTNFSGYATYQDLLLSDNDCGIFFACLLLAVRSVVENVRVPLGLLERGPVQNES
jgi:hypothetical protein